MAVAHMSEFIFLEELSTDELCLGQKDSSGNLTELLASGTVTPPGNKKKKHSGPSERAISGSPLSSRPSFMANLSEETSLDEEEQFSVCQQKNSQHEKKTPAESPFSPILFAYSEDFALPELPLRAPLYSDLSNSWDSSAASQLEFPSAVHNSEGDDSSPPSSPLLDANQGESKASSYTKPVPVRYDHSEDDSEEIDIESVTATATKRGRLKQPQRTKGGQKARSRRKKASDDEYEDAPLSTTARKNRRSSSRRNKNAPTHNRRKEDDDTGVAEEEQEPCEAYNDYLAKKKLLHTITHVLPRDKLAGIIDIVNPSYSDADGNSDVLEFGECLVAINVLSLLVSNCFFFCRL
ncbi:hypothetical protein QOT17_012712 [Balamuthia mandrillaris]